MILQIYSKYGVLECKPMELQAIENSIPPATKEQNQVVQGDQGQTPSDPFSQRGVVEGDECPF